jgi:hypothetical protein
VRIRLCKRITQISCQSLVVPACRARISEGASNALFGGPRISNYLGIPLRLCRTRDVRGAVIIRPTKRIARIWYQRSVAPARGSVDSGSVVEGAPTEEPRPDASNARRQRPATRATGVSRAFACVLNTRGCPGVLHAPVIHPVRVHKYIPGRQVNAVWGR